MTVPFGTPAVSGDTGCLAIAPMLLLPFVENAFKHGISLRSLSRIDIGLTLEDGILVFCAENTVHRSSSETGNGDSALGLKNVRRRLELLYPDAHHLSVSEVAEQFRVVLRLTLR